jgi:hypothetical protein
MYYYVANYLRVYSVRVNITRISVRLSPKSCVYDYHVTLSLILQLDCPTVYVGYVYIL